MNYFKKGDRVIAEALHPGHELYLLGKFTGTVADDMPEIENMELMLTYRVSIDRMDGKTYLFFAYEMEKISTEKELEAIEKSDAKDDCCEKKMEDKAKMEDEVKEDKVNHPRHYDLPGGGQAINVINDMLDDAEIEGYYKGNIIKYIARYKKKGGAESLKKARWYLDILIALKEAQEEMRRNRHEI